MACTGIEFCKLAIGETKGRRAGSEELDRRLPGFDEEVRVHVNGCPNSCARFQVADIGLMSALAKRPDGTKSEAFLVHLGGGWVTARFREEGQGRAVLAEDAADYVEALVRRYARRGEATTTRSRRSSAGLDDDELARFATPEAADELGTPRAVPFYCPFCGEQDLRPADPSGRLAVRVCERAVRAQLVAIGGDG